MFSVIPLMKYQSHFSIMVHSAGLSYPELLPKVIAPANISLHNAYFVEMHMYFLCAIIKVGHGKGLLCQERMIQS